MVAASSQNLASSTEDLNSSHPVSVGEYFETVSKINLYLTSSSVIAEPIGNHYKLTQN